MAWLVVWNYLVLHLSFKFLKNFAFFLVFSDHAKACERAVTPLNAYLRLVHQPPNAGFGGPGGSLQTLCIQNKELQAFSCHIFIDTVIVSRQILTVNFPDKGRAYYSFVNPGAVR